MAKTRTVPGGLVRPIIAIVGRPNVGKSTLFNRLVGQRRALVRDVPGVTRDRLYGQVAFERWQATVIDTGGFDPSTEEPLIDGVRRQVMIAVEEADLVLFVVDARAGVTALDAEIATRLRRSDRPVVLVANKIDGGGMEVQIADLYRLGFGEPAPVSAEHGRGVAELLEVVRARAPLDSAPPSPRGVVHLAVIGRPNVGKSSLVNAMIGAERVLVHDVPGTTRDSVDTAFEHDGRPYVLVDTAGIRRKGRVNEALEKLSVVMALRSLERCQVALVVLDASEGLTAQDSHIAGYAHDAGRAVVLVVNKWDLVPPNMVRKAEVVDQLRERLPFLDYAPVCFTSATESRGVPEIFETVNEVAAAAQRRVSTSEATEVLRQAVERRPASVRGEALTVQSAVQVSVAPPTFALKVNHPEEIHFSYERYLVRSLRLAFGFAGSPIRLSLRRASTSRPRRSVRP
ncbi:MAG TPA: ribosome biogenesis GTPase Der [Methylomirabilota bacterium]|jgi:GTP-binding protein|nr:ribosome biogenesis GTPase Der [Methylomirabilota bacterium]